MKKMGRGWISYQVCVTILHSVGCDVSTALISRHQRCWTVRRRRFVLTAELCRTLSTVRRRRNTSLPPTTRTTHSRRSPG